MKIVGSDGLWSLFHNREPVLYRNQGGTTVNSSLSCSDLCERDFFMNKERMKQMKEKLSQILDSALGQIEASKELDKLNEIRVSFLGKKGELTSVLKSMKEVAPEDRPKVGQMVNEARQR